MMRTRNTRRTKRRTRRMTRRRTEVMGRIATAGRRRRDNNNYQLGRD